jgi:hypothetical protein
VANGFLSANAELDAAEERLSSAARALRVAADTYEATARADAGLWRKLAAAAHEAAEKSATLRAQADAAMATADRLATVYADRDRKRGWPLQPGAFDAGTYGVTDWSPPTPPMSEEDELDARARAFVRSMHGQRRSDDV